jgi:hypothetical protein
MFYGKQIRELSSDVSCLEHEIKALQHELVEMRVRLKNSKISADNVVYSGLINLETGGGAKTEVTIQRLINSILKHLSLSVVVKRQPAFDPVQLVDVPKDESCKNS